MNCEEIKNLLSEYLDGRLNDRARMLVEEHLENCPECRREFEGLKECLKEIGSLGKVEPPSDFLNQIHSRMEEQSVYKSAIKKIFLPIRFKIPLEAAGLAAAAVLIVYILNISPDNKSKQSIPPTALREIREKPDSELQITVAAKPISRQDNKRVRISMKPAAPPPTEELMMFEPSAPLPAPGDKSVGGGMKQVELVILIESEAAYTQPETRMNGNLLRMEAGIPLSVASPKMEERDELSQSPRLNRLKDLIGREGGEIISTEDGADHTRRIAIKLPEDRYHPFMEKLSEISDLPAHRSSPPKKAGRTIRLRLNRIVSED